MSTASIDNFAAHQVDRYRALPDATLDVSCSVPASQTVQNKYEQPDKPRRGVRTDDVVGMELAARLRELFYQYTNRTGRSSQTTLGPSEIGTPCDRRLAMSLLGMPKVNPGGDGWAAFVGTCVHAGLADMFDWADANQGRFVTELKVHFPNSHVPRGTLDLLDRVLYMVDDHKVMGSWSLNDLRTNGPSRVYRVQLHVYAMGARQRGERVDRVALIGWPRAGSNLDDLYVWSEPYDPSIAREALARVDAIQARIDQGAAATDFTIEDDCKFCPYYMQDAKDMSNGCCNGRV